MNSSKIKIALAMIMKADDREAELLDRCLGGATKDNIMVHHKKVNLKKTDGLAKHVDKIFLTITGHNQKCEDVAAKYGAIVSHYDWDYNFAKARNFNFSQVPLEYEYILWTDADDVWENPKLIRLIVEKSHEEKVDAIALKYKYDFDDYGNCIVEHLKTRIVKNDGCVSWLGEIHEDFQENRRLLLILNKDINVIHLTDTKRVAFSTARNVHIAELAVKSNSKDPHSYWNLANTYLMAGKSKEALPIYLQFLDISNSDEERFISWHRLASIYANLGDHGRAIGCELEALSLRPWYPDPYLQLGEFYFNIGKLRHAQEMAETCLKKELPEVEAIVWNPLDYKYNPHALLAKVYLGLNKPREAVKSLKSCLKLRPKDKRIKDLIKSLQPEIDKFDIADKVYKKAKNAKTKEEVENILKAVPKDLEFYPPIISLRNRYFIKTESSGKDVAIMCSYTEHEWDPDVANNAGVGGSEEAVIQLAKRWQKAGYNVTVFANTVKSQEYEFDGVKWKPFMAWNFRDKYDVTVLWRHPKLLDFDINSPKIYLDMHDVVQKAEFTAARMKKVTAVIFKSEAQKKHYPNVPTEKALVIPHGLDVEEFDSQRNIERNPYRILNTSSPDRGIKTCMIIIKKVHEKLPEELKSKLKFAQYYGFNVWDGEFSNNKQMLAWKEDVMGMMNELKSMGIMDKDSGIKLPQNRVTVEYLKSGILLYPSTFFEIGFISGFKAMLAGCIPLTTDIFAQGEFMRGIKIHSDVTSENWIQDIESGVDYGVKNVDEVVNRLVDYLTNVDKYEIMRQEIIDYAKQFTWNRTAEAWVNEFNK
ncbi:MAG: hypothetical protein AABW93_03120 [Nanoarchaeota archaeon]